MRKILIILGLLVLNICDRAVVFADVINIQAVIQERTLLEKMCAPEGIARCSNPKQCSKYSNNPKYKLLKLPNNSNIEPFDHHTYCRVEFLRKSQ